MCKCKLLAFKSSSNVNEIVSKVQNFLGPGGKKQSSVFLPKLTLALGCSQIKAGTAEQP